MSSESGGTDVENLLSPAADPLTLQGLRVIELADEKAEYCGLVLAGLGAEVVKIEPPRGASTRDIGPFYRDEKDPERSLFFWQYNRGKQSIVLDLDTDEGRDRLEQLLERADVFLDGTPPDYMDGLRLGRAALEARMPSLIHARITPFGDDGPWVDFKGSDLIHLALGGPMMNCGYDPRPDGTYDLPPFAPQMWHAYHIAGEQLTMGILASLVYREKSGHGQYVSCAIHEAVAKNTEGDWPNWVMRRAPFLRQTCRHAMEVVTELPMIGNTKDGRWVITRGPVRPEGWNRMKSFLESQGMTLEDDSWLAPKDEAAEKGGRAIPGSRPGPTNIDERAARATEMFHRVLKRYTFAEVPWLDAQKEGFLWAPLFKPHDNVSDSHWIKRGTFAEVEHPELGESFTYCVSKWLSTEAGWAVGRRAPLIGEDSSRLEEIVAEPRRRIEVRDRAQEDASERGKPWALQDVRILDFTWFLASGGATRFLAALGAETIKVEWKGNPDTRFGAQAPVGGREARREATAPLPPVMDGDMGGQFNNKHPGKYGISLNVKDPRGLEIARELAKNSDIVAEGFSPGVMDKLGLGYDVLQGLREDIIYCQQSAMGSVGTYQNLRTLGPLAQALGALSEMSGLPEPAMPAGWGYSYLDWIGAYSFASAMLGALYYRERTGRGQRIDASQTEVGLYINGTAIVDYTANGREYQRVGNRSPYKPAAPHGAYPCEGEDRWIAIACFDDDEWSGLIKVLGQPDWARKAEFQTLESRIANQNALDAYLAQSTMEHERYELMYDLQSAGVPAGVCQTAEDRCDTDPKLHELGWLVELTGTKIGTWPVGEVPVRLDRTPTYIGGRPNRSAPCYGEDNYTIYSELLGLSEKEIRRLEEDGVI